MSDTTPDLAERELRGVVDRLDLVSGKDALATVLAEYHRRGVELDRLRPRVAELECRLVRTQDERDDARTRVAELEAEHEAWETRTEWGVRLRSTVSHTTLAGARLTARNWGGEAVQRTVHTSPWVFAEAEETNRG